MHTTVEREDFPDDETPTRREALTGKWIVAVDRGARKLEDAILRLEAGDKIEEVIEELKKIRALVNGRT